MTAIIVAKKGFTDFQYASMLYTSVKLRYSCIFKHCIYDLHSKRGFTIKGLSHLRPVKMASEIL